jgi:hypothetical protein
MKSGVQDPGLAGSDTRAGTDEGEEGKNGGTNEFQHRSELRR